jgi:outer membrane protein TolC
MKALQRRTSRRALGVAWPGRACVAAVAAFQFGWLASADAQSPASPPSAPDGAGVLLLGDLYAQVERVSPRLAMARALTQAANARVPGATRPPDPQVQLGVMNYMVPNRAPMPLLGMRQVQVMQMLPLGGKLALSGRVAGARASAVAERAQEVSWELRGEAAMAFYDLYALERRQNVMRETVRLLQDIEKTASAMSRVGEGRQSDVLRAQVEIARMVEDAVRMQAMRLAMEARPNALLDRATETPVGTPALPAFPAALPERAALDSMAYLHRPMLRAALDEVRGSGASRREHRGRAGGDRDSDRRNDHHPNR